MSNLGRAATLAEARSLVSGTPFAEDAADVLGMMADLWPVRIVDGPLSADALDVDAVLVVRGDVDVKGCLGDVPSDHGAMLVVLGDLSTHDLVFHGPIFVTGRASVTGTAFLASSGDWVLAVGGDFVGGTLVEYDHAIEVTGETRFRHVFRRGQDPSPLFVDSLLYSDQKTRRENGALVEVTVHYIDPAPMEDAIRAGRNILRSPT